MVSIIRAIGNLPNTFWGILVLFASMWIAVHYSKDVGFYFAGVGSTLLGINHIRPSDTTATVTTNPTSIKVESNASDQASNA